MKKTLLLLAAAAFAGVSASAQAINLTGTSYMQDFNNLASGLPAGWAVYSGASATTAGNDVSSSKFTSTPSKWNSTNGGFRNSASMNGVTPATYTADSAAQAAMTDRALAVRQVGATSTSFPGSDSGAAFVFKFMPAAGSTDFKLNFKLQSSDTASGRTTAWTVQYGKGTPPAFTTAPTVTGTLTTGGKTMSNNAISVDFGNSLDNNTQEMWIRIVALTGSTGTGTRATTQIDDFNLTWTGGASAVSNVAASNLPLTLLGNGITNDVKASFTAPENGAYTVTVTDLAGRMISTLENKATKGENVTIPVASTTLASGMYLVRVAQGTFAGTMKMSVR